MNHLEDTENGDCEDSGMNDVCEADDNMFALTATNIAPSLTSFVDRNTFEEHVEDGDEMLQDVINRFSQWAHRVNSASANLKLHRSKPKPKISIQMFWKKLDERVASKTKLPALSSKPEKLQLDPHVEESLGSKFSDS